MALAFQERSVETIRGSRVALVATPTKPLVFTRGWARALRKSRSMSDLDREIVDQVDQRRGRVQVFVFRGHSPDRAASWQLDPDVEFAEAVDMGGVMIRSQMPVYRHFLLAGVLMTAHFDWGKREVAACQTALRDLAVDLTELVEAQEQAGRDDETARLARLDLWIARHMLVFNGGVFERAMGHWLPQALGLLAPRLPRIRELVQVLPESALERPSPAGIP